MKASGKPDLKPVVGLNLDWGEILCPDGSCWLSNVETSFAYRVHSSTKAAFSTNIIVPGAVASPGAEVNISTFDFYQPDIYALGITYDAGQTYKIGATLELQRWSQLTSALKGDTVRRVAVDPTSAGAQYANVKPLKFRDIIIPRVGVEYRLNQRYTLSGGISYEQTPLDSNTSLDINYLDGDKLILGLGIAAKFDNPFLLAHPVTLEFGYQRQQFSHETFHITSTDLRFQGNAGAELETVKTKGYVNVFSGALTMRF